MPPAPPALVARLRRRVLSGAVVLAVLAVLAVAGGCSSPVQVAPFEGSESPECLAVAEQWPADVAGMPERVTAANSETVAAWGDPPVISRCGAAPPMPTTDQCLDISGVDWVVHELTDGQRFTTYGRDPAIEVLVPDDYAPEPLLMPAFGEAAEVVPQGEQRCL